MAPARTPDTTSAWMPGLSSQGCLGTRTRPKRRTAALALAAALLMTAFTTTVSNAALPYHGGTFECYYNASTGARTIRAHVPEMKSTTAGEPVYWFASVYKSTSSGLSFVNNTLGSSSAQGWANQNGVVSGVYAPDYKWVNTATRRGLTNGGTVEVAGPGTYQVAGYFWWSSSSQTWTGRWATYWNNSASAACTFNR